MICHHQKGGDCEEDFLPYDLWLGFDDDKAHDTKRRKESFKMQASSEDKDLGLNCLNHVSMVLYLCFIISQVCIT